MKVHINGETYTLPMSDEQLTAHHLTTDMTVTVPDLTELPFSHIYDIKHIFTDPDLTLEDVNTFAKYAEIREVTITNTQGLAEYIEEYPGKTSIYEIMDIIEQAYDDKLNFTEFYYPGIANDLSADIDEKLGETYFYLSDYESKIDAAQDELGEAGRYLTFDVGAYGRDLRLSGNFILTDEGFIDQARVDGSHKSSQRGRSKRPNYEKARRTVVRTASARTKSGRKDMESLAPTKAARRPNRRQKG